MQSPRMWSRKYVTYDLGHGLMRRKGDHYVYFKIFRDLVIYMVLHVDDMFFIANDRETIQDVKTQISYKFENKDLNAANFILDMEIKRD